MDDKNTPQPQNEEVKEVEMKTDAPQEDDFTKCQRERDEYLDGWKRAKADLINYKKDETKRFESIVKFGQTSLILELISVLDSFDLALISDEIKQDKKSEKGMLLIRQQLLDILRRSGLEEIKINQDNKFDPNFHEAIGEVQSDKSSGTIVEQIEKGYLLNNKVIRPARVKLSK